MAGTDGTPTDRVAALAPLLEDPLRFEVFEAMRRIEAAHPHLPRLGKASRASDDPVRLRQEASLSFAPTSITECTREEGEPIILTQLFFGLWGPQGAMPTHLTDYARGRVRNAKDPALVRFADLFTHRMLELLYRTWADARPVCHLDRPDDDRYSAWMGALVGFGTSAAQGRSALPDAIPLFFANRFAIATRNAEGLRACIEKYFGLRCSVEQWVPAWMSLTPDSYSRLGHRGQGSRLGEGAVLGENVWSVQHRFRVVLGPTTLKRLKRFLPGEGTLRRLTALVDAYAGPEFDWELQILLVPSEVPPLQLGKEALLGWTTWLPQQGRTHNVGDYTINAARLQAEHASVAAVA